jgi:hypothetical protein
VIGVTRSNPVVFAALAVKTTTRGFLAGSGADRTDDIVPLIGQAAEVALPE